MKWSFSTASVAFAAFPISLAIVACGDDTSATGGGGGSTATSTGAGSPTSSSASGSPTSTGSASGNSSGESSSGVASSGQGGSVASSGQGGSGQGGAGQGGSGDGGNGQGGGAQGGGAQGGNGQGGEPSGVPCFDECANDAGCELTPPAPGNTCGTCVLAEATTQGDCAVQAAFGDGCQGFDPCADYVMCRINGGNDCEATYPEGAQRAQAEALFYCGRCGDGGSGQGGSGAGGGGQGGDGAGGGSGLPCGDACANDAGCDLEPANPGITCAACVQTQANAQAQCAVDAALGDACQSDADCTDYVTCVLTQGSNCEQTYADGYEIARQEAFFTCGGCGDGAS